MSYKLSEIIAKFGGKLEGSDVVVTDIAATNHAMPGSLTFFTDKKYKEGLESCSASAIIISSLDAKILDNLNSNMSRIISDNPYLYYSFVSKLFYPHKNLTTKIAESCKVGQGVQIGSSPAIADYVVIGDQVKIGNNCQIYPHVVIGNDVIIGNNAIIYPHVTLYSNVKIGNSCTIHSGAVIGADGFGYAQDSKKAWHKIPQVGGVVIGNDVEIGANTTIDSGALSPTVIEDGVKIDNLVQIAHNNRIGTHAAIAAGAGIAGGTTIGKYCRIGGAAGITGHVKIADHTVIGAASNVSKDITTPDIYSSGIPVFPYKEWARIMVHMRNLGQTNDKIKALEKQVKELNNYLSANVRIRDENEE
jgi:UDP-3-O-[3-hydroxymyristoyl] glucosamine N-acyltransferase